MSRKKNTVKAPFLKWLLEHGVIYSVFALVAVLGFAGVVHSGYANYQTIISQKKVSSPYADVEATDSIGMKWAADFIAQAPENATNWTVGNTSKPQSIVAQKHCSTIGTPPTSLLATYTATGENIETTIQVYGAGQAAQQFSKYASTLGECLNAQLAENNVVRYDNSFVLLLGDSIIGVKGTNENIDSLLNWYKENASKTLTDSGCLELNTTVNDAKRSFFYDKDSYEGFKKSDLLKTKIDFSNLPTPQGVTIQQITNSTAVEPEAPLPDKFPKMPKTVAQPSLPSSIPDQNSFEAKATYQVADTDGPGCGWAWAGQKAPEYNEEDLRTAKQKVITETQEKLDESTTSYVNSKVSWAFNVALTIPQIDKWNAYVKQVNDVYAKWDWLNAERTSIQNDWYSYVAAHNEWITFDTRKKEAAEKYQKDVDTCMAKREELQDWENKYGDNADTTEPETETTPEPSDSPTPTVSPTPTPTPTVSVPPKPEGCDTMPVKPEILDQTKPAEPQPPTIPEGVTIPDSWPKIN